jgi:hypothetical protein
MGSVIAQNIILLGCLVVQVVTLRYLIKYVRATVGIQKAAGEQTQASQDLARWQRTQWDLDNRKQEWRELIEVWVRCAHRIESAKRSAQASTFAPFNKGAAQPIQEALGAAQAVLSNRLYIRDAVQKENLGSMWREIEGYYQPATTNFSDLSGFQEKWSVLHERLFTAAKTDLGIDRGAGFPEGDS